MKIIGYARTTITDNNLETQLETLTNYGCHDVYYESFDVTAIENPISELEKAISKLKSHDTLVVCRLNHLGKSTRQLTELTEVLKNTGAHLVSIDEGIDTRQPMGEVYFNLMEGLASMECDLIKERTLVGLNNARKKGKIGGRPKISHGTVKKIRHLYYEKKETIQHISSKCDVSVGTCYKYIKLCDDEVKKNNNQ